MQLHLLVPKLDGTKIQPRENFVFQVLGIFFNANRTKSLIIKTPLKTLI